MQRFRILVVFVLAFAWLVPGLAQGAAQGAGALKVGGGPVDLPGLQHVVRLSERLYSGGAPEGEAGFGTLRGLGIKTVLTVDGAAPDVRTAHRFGMRYVHVPFGYDGCPAPTANVIVKAVRDLPGPLYLHCHHGKHRSPVAAAMARIALDGISNEEAVRELERAGTGKNYTGLYADVRGYRPPTRAELDALKVELREVAPTPPLVRTMVDLETRSDRLLQAQKDGWKAPAGVDLPYEALQLRELYAELLRAKTTRGRPADFRKWLTDGERDARTLEGKLRAGSLEEAGPALGRLAAGCASCHARYRNVPQ